MKLFRLMPAIMPVILVCALAGCFGPKNSESSKEERERRERKEQAEHRQHRKKGVPEKVEKKRFGGEDEENEEYDGILAAQQREFDMTHDPATNSVPKERLINALSVRNRIIAERNNNLSTTNGIIHNGITTTIDATSWVERGSYKDSAGPYGNPRDSVASTSGRISALWVDADPTKPNQIFIGGIDGGLWSCPDITASAPAWTFIDNFSNLAISSICQDPTNSNTMYFGTGEKTFNADAVRGGGVWKSTDHGVSWTLLPNTTTFYNVSKVLCDKFGNVFVGTIGSGAGLQRSLDGGNTWTNITPNVANPSNSALTLVTSRVSDMVYDATRDTMHVYMGYFPTAASGVIGYCYGKPSTVTATTWSTPTTANGAGMAIAAAAATSSTTAYEQMVQLAVKNGVVWALRGNYGNMVLYRSINGGATWTTQVTYASSLTQYGVGQDWYSMALDCDPQNPTNNVIFGNLNVFKSTNGGTTFNQVSEWVTGANSGAPTQYVHADVHNVYYNTTAGGLNRVIVCSDGGVFYSTNGGINWADRNVGLRLKQFYSCAINPSVPDYFLAGAQDNGSHRFTQPGLGASTEVNGGDGAIVAIDQLNPNNQFTSYVYNSYHVSKDGGNTWSSNTFGSSVGQFVNPFDFDSKTKKFYAAYSAGNYLRWDDPTTTQTTSSIISVSSVIGANIPTAVTVSSNLANTIYVGGGGKVAKVVNANTATPTVTAITPPTITSGSTVSSIIIGPSTTDQDMIVTCSNYGVKKVFITANGGTTWTEITGNLPDMPVRWALFYPGSNTQAYLATEAGVWFTTSINGANTVWQPSGNFPAVRSDMIKYAATNGTIAVGTHGRGLWSTKISTIPKVSFYSTLLNTSKSLGTATTGCRTYADYSDTLQISDAPTGAATVTLTVQPGSTARQGIDFDFTTNGSFTSPSTTATFASGVYPSKVPIKVRIYNNHDKNAVLPLTAGLAFTISGTTDATISLANQVLALNLTDVFPLATTQTAQTLWSENWESWPATFSSWKFEPEEYYGADPYATAFIPYPNYGCSDVINGTTAQLFTNDVNGNLALCTNGNGGAYTARFSRVVAAATNHYSNMSVAFNYKSGANANITNTIVYSIDNGVTWNTLASYAAKTTTTATTVTIPAALNNTNFLLGWQSVGTAAATYSAYGYGVDDIVLTGNIAAPPIDSTAGSTATNYENSAQSIDFFSANSNIFANIANPSVDLGCVTATIENAGNTWQPFAGGNRSQKSFLITPTTNASSATYNATLYFTNAELAGMNPATLKIAKTSASSVALADASNTVLVSPTTSTYNNYGVGFTGSFSGFSRYFLVDGNVLFPIAFTGCPNLNLAIARPGYNVYNGEPVSMYMMDTATGAATLIPGGPLKDYTGKKNVDINGAGVNSQDGFVYAIHDTINTAGTAASAMLYRIGSNYGNYPVGTLSAPALSNGENLAVVNPAAGSFDNQDNYYYIGMAGAYSFTTNTFVPSSYYIGKVANVSTLTGGTATLTATWTKMDFSNVACGTFKSSLSMPISSTSGTGASTSFQDIAFSNLYRSLYVYAAYNSGGSYVGQLLAINPSTGVATCYAAAPFGAVNNEVAGISTTNSGSLRVFMTGGDVYKTNVLGDGSFTGAFTKIGASGIPALGVMGSIRGDLASCAVGPTSLPSMTLPGSITIGLPNQIVAYPNPATGITNITVGQPLTNATVRLLGVSGNVIAERNGVSGFTFTMDLTGKPGGMYFVEITQGGNVQKVKLVKQ